MDISDVVFGISLFNTHPKGAVFRIHVNQNASRFFFNDFSVPKLKAPLSFVNDRIDASRLLTVVDRAKRDLGKTVLLQLFNPASFVYLKLWAMAPGSAFLLANPSASF